MAMPIMAFDEQWRSKLNVEFGIGVGLQIRSQKLASDSDTGLEVGERPLIPELKCAAHVEHTEHVEHAVPIVAAWNGRRPELVNEWFSVRSG